MWNRHEQVISRSVAYITMPNRYVPWKNTKRDIAEILGDPQRHLLTIPPHVVAFIPSESMCHEVCWYMLVAACSPTCLPDSVPYLLIKALGIITPSTLTNKAIQGLCAGGPSAIGAVSWVLLPRQLDPFSPRERALIQLQWARDAFIDQGWMQPQIMGGAPIYPDEPAANSGVDALNVLTPRP